jgi:hypothetical protein
MQLLLMTAVMVVVCTAQCTRGWRWQWRWLWIGWCRWWWLRVVVAMEGAAAVEVAVAGASGGIRGLVALVAVAMVDNQVFMVPITVTEGLSRSQRLPIARRR